jgi:DNA-directed RNA polymerase sigma subunit (sigma70/sigma32)
LLTLLSSRYAQIVRLRFGQNWPERPSDDGSERLLTLLSPRCAQIVRLRFGQNWILEEVGQVLGITHERLPQIQTASEKAPPAGNAPGGGAFIEP